MVPLTLRENTGRHMVGILEILFCFQKMRGRVADVLNYLCQVRVILAKAQYIRIFLWSLVIRTIKVSFLILSMVWQRYDKYLLTATIHHAIYPKTIQFVTNTCHISQIFGGLFISAYICIKESMINCNFQSNKKV